jgi:hypothetical protein
MARLPHAGICHVSSLSGLVNEAKTGMSAKVQRTLTNLRVYGREALAR